MKRISLLLLVCLLPGARAYGDIACTGSDDTATLSGALNTACNAGGGEVVLPPATCVVSPNPTPLFLCSNLTIRGAGAKSVLKVKDGAGSYASIFAAPAQVLISNVVIKDFRIDQNPAGNSVQPGNETLHVINLAVIGGGASGVSRITVSGMFFDPIHAVHAIHAENRTDLWATITKNYFNFQRSPGTTQYNNAAIYLEGSQQVVTSNTFVSTPPSGSSISYANSAIETHGGRSTISNNTTNTYATLVNVVPTSAAFTTILNPNDVAIANNSVTCAQIGISLWPLPLASTPAPAGTISNVSITGNTINVCNMTRRTAGSYLGSKYFAGIRVAYEPPNVRNVDGLVVSDNVIAMESDTNYGLAEDEAVSTGGIVLSATGSLSNVVVSGNVVKNSPMSGIRVGLIAGTPTVNGTVQVARVVDNTIVDAGNNAGAASQAIYQHAIGVFGNATEVDVARNMIYDTTNPNTGLVNGLYSLHVKQASSPSTTTIRTSQNTVRVNSTDPTVQLRSAFPSPNAGIVDATNANNVLVSSILGSAGLSLAVDFISFTRYITTISGSSSSQLTLSVPAPSGDTSNPPSYVQMERRAIGDV